MSSLRPLLLGALVALILSHGSEDCRAGAMYTVTQLRQSDGGSPVFDAQGNVAAKNGPYYNTARQQAGPYSIATTVGASRYTTYALAKQEGRDSIRIEPVTSAGYYGYTTAEAVNIAGTFVGSQNQLPNGVGNLGRAIMFTREGGTKLLPTPFDGDVSIAHSINDAGLIVGASNGHAFLTDGKVAWDLNSLIAPDSGFLLTSATDINSQGQILATTYNYIDGKPYYYDVLLTPTATPEPSTLALLAAGGVLYLSVRKQRSRRRTDR